MSQSITYAEPVAYDKFDNKRRYDDDDDVHYIHVMQIAKPVRPLVTDVAIASWF